VKIAELGELAAAMREHGFAEVNLDADGNIVRARLDASATLAANILSGRLAASDASQNEDPSSVVTPIRRVTPGLVPRGDRSSD
jgi:hypothetical protein